MKNIIYLLVFFISFTSFSQKKAIEITNITTKKVVLYEENQRVKIRTLNGKKIVGNLKISDSINFTVNDQAVRIDSLKSIKKYPKNLSTVKNVALIAGLATIASSVIAGATGNESAFMLFSVGAGVTIGAGILESKNPNNSIKNWTFKIIRK